jgi:hypothetical protein
MIIALKGNFLKVKIRENYMKSILIGLARKEGFVGKLMSD